MNVRGAQARIGQLISLGRAAEAEALARELVAGGEQDEHTFVLLSASLRHQGRYEEAEEAARAALREDIESSDAHAEIARVLLARGRDHQAADAAREAVRLNPYSTVALHSLCDAVMHVSLPEAEAAAASIQQLNPHSSLGSSLRASVEIARKRWPEAERWLRESLRADPLSPSGHANLALVLDQQGRREEARAEHEEAVRLDPRRVVPRQNLHVALRLDRVKGAVGRSQYGADLVGSTLSDAARARGLTMLIQQSLRSASLAEARAAASELRDLVARMPLEGLEERRARVLALMSIARVEHHEDPRAEAAMVAPLHDEARAVLGAKDLHVYLNNLAVAHLRAGDRASVEAFRQVVELTRTTGNPDTLGMALLNQGAAHSAHLEDVEAERCYAEALELAAANGHHARAARLCCNLAQGRLRRGDAAGARVLSEEAVRWLEGRDEPAVRAKVMVTMGGVELREAALEHARRTLLTSLQAMRRAGTTTEVDAHVYLAEIAARTGRPRLAALHMSRADRRARSPQTRETVRRGYALIDQLATKDR